MRGRIRGSGLPQPLDQGPLPRGFAGPYSRSPRRERERSKSGADVPAFSESRLRLAGQGLQVAGPVGSDSAARTLCG